MNKYQEAFDHLCKHTEQLQKFQLVDCPSFNKGSYENDKALMKELVDKAAPKKVENKKDHYVFDTTEYSHTSGECPNCQESVYYDEYHQGEYCSNCGQRLDWSER